MKSLKTIFTVLFSIAFATTGAFGAADCKNPTYRAAYPEKCVQTKSNNGTFWAIAGGAALVGVGVALASQSSGDGGSSSTISNQTTFPRLTLSGNINTTYAQNAQVQNQKVSYYSLNSLSDSGDLDTYKLDAIKSSENYLRNKKQYDAINFAAAPARGFTGKNVSINVVDDFNTYHGHTVYEIVHNVASDANIVRNNIANSENNLQSFDYIANSINKSGAFDIYNASWQIPASDTMNAAHAIYNDTNSIKTYASAQDYMYGITSYNFITQIRNSAIDNDSIFVWAAGNEGKTESGALSALPLAFPELNGHFVNVVAVDNYNNLAWYSNQCGITQNYCIAAPGSGWNTDAKDYASGTSFATPVVSGAIATIKEAFPYMNAEKITQLLFVTARDLGDTGVDSVFGWGLLDMERATRPVGEAKIVLANDTIQPLNLSAVSGSAASAIKNANIKIAFVDDFGRAFTTNLSDNINVIPYGRGFEKLTETESDSVALFDNFEMGFKQNHLLESSGLVSVKSNSVTNFIGHKNEFSLNNIKFYQNARIGMTGLSASENSIVSEFSNIYTASAKIGATYDKLTLEIAVPETIISGNMYMNLPVGMNNDGKMMYSNTNINLATRPSVEYTVKYGALSATFVDNPDFQNEVYLMAKTKFAF